MQLDKFKNQPLNFYIEENPGDGLGNFIQCTPTIRHLSNHYNQPIPVYFNREWVKQCFIDIPYLTPISEKKGIRLFGSELHDLDHRSTPDFEYIQKIVLGEVKGNETFIRNPNKIQGDYGVFINGAGSENPNYLQQKLVNSDIQQIVRDNSKDLIIGLGSKNDEARNIFPGCYGDIEIALNIIGGEKWVITNNTGFYHVAGALKKDQLILWKDCPYPRSTNPNPNCRYSFKDKWEEGIINFLKEMDEK